MARESPAFPLRAHAAHASEAGTNVRFGDAAHMGFVGARPMNLHRQIGCEIPRRHHGQSTCDRPSPVAAVMLHLRSCYVSKAAILTLPIRFVPVENRSPA